MIPRVQLSVEVDEKAIQEYINEKLDESIRKTLFLWDINEMARQTCMSKSF